MLYRHNVIRRVPNLDLCFKAHREQRNPSQFQVWLLDRLESKPASDICLDQFDLYATSQYRFRTGWAATVTGLPN